MSLRSLGAAWVSGDLSARAWLGSFDRESVLQSLAASHPPRLSNPVLEALREVRENHRPSCLPALSALERNSAGIVVTGQQAGLLTGPLYTVHKAASTVLLAEVLSQATQRHFVPVFWVQDEDHDFEEIRRAYWLEDKALRLIEAARSDRRVSVAEVAVPVQLQQDLRLLLRRNQNARFGSEVEALVAPWLQEGALWSRSFVACLAWIFENSPLLFIHGRSANLSMGAAPLYRRATEAHPDIQQALSQRGQDLKRDGFQEQIPARPDCLLSFYHSTNGHRHRPRIDNNEVEVQGHVFSKSEFADRAEQEPTLFSTSALLRPIVQDRLLSPSVQLVGPGEAAYLAQVSALRDIFDAPAPALMPRGGGTWLEPFVQRSLKRRGLQERDFHESTVENLVARLTPSENNSEHPDVLARLTHQALAPFLGLNPTHPQLIKSHARTVRSLRRNTGRFLGRALRLHAESQHQLYRELSHLDTILKPMGVTQERLLSVTHLIAHYGRDRVLDVFQQTHTVFSAERMQFCL